MAHLSNYAKKIVEKEFDDHGTRRLANIPESDLDVPFREAIIVDFYDELRLLYKSCPDEFLSNLWTALWDIGIRRKSDLHRPDAQNRISQAIRSAIRHDVATILSLREEA